MSYEVSFITSTRNDGVPVSNQYSLNFRESNVFRRLNGLYIPSVSSQKWYPSYICASSSLQSSDDKLPALASRSTLSPKYAASSLSEMPQMSV